MKDANKPQDFSVGNIVQILSNKSVLKQLTYVDSIKIFQQLKKEAEKIIDKICEKFDKKKTNIKVRFLDKGGIEFRIFIGGDALVFLMHTNVFYLPPNHTIYHTDYVKENTNRAYCCMISVYNFLSDSFKYNRINDTGALIYRILINAEKNFFVEERGIVNNKIFGQFGAVEFNVEQMQKLIKSSILDSMQLDLYLPPFAETEMVLLSDILSLDKEYKIKTSKRLGFNY